MKNNLREKWLDFWWWFSVPAVFVIPALIGFIVILWQGIHK